MTAFFVRSVGRNDRLLQKIKVFFFSEKAGQVGGNSIQHLHQLIPAVLLRQESVVSCEIFKTCLTEPFA